MNRRRFLFGGAVAGAAAAFTRPNFAKALTENTYYPDTCDCIVVYSFDPQAEIPVFTHERTVRKGAEHAGVIDGSLMQTIFEENRRKNRALETARSLSGENAVTWSFDPGRTLTVTFLVNVPAAIKAKIQEWCDTNLGIGKVIIL